MEFKKASKKKSKLRAAFFGPSGAGKTYSALRVASGMGEKIAVIDTERGSASLYADRFNFDVLELPDFRIDTYCEAIQAAGQAGFDVLVIDSLSQGWAELLSEVERIAKAKYRGNTWSAWSEGTPMQRRFVETLLQFPGHVIATMRSKTEWATETAGNGKSRPSRIGLAPEQGKGIEYEFSILLEINTDHVANVIKDRTGKFQDKLIDKPGEDFGKQLVQWLAEGAEPEPPKQDPRPEMVSNIRELLGRLYGEDYIDQAVETHFTEYVKPHYAKLEKDPPLVPEQLSVKWLDSWHNKLEEQIVEKEAA